MNFVLQPWQLLLAILAGWSNRRQQEGIENRVFKEKLGKRRIVLANDAVINPSAQTTCPR